jgi:hypothetical protein
METERKKNALEDILSKLMLKMHKNEAIDYAWDYFYKAPYTWKGHSSKLNIKTTLEIYYKILPTDTLYEEGTILHYTHTGSIYGTSTDKDENGIPYGEQPIFYYGSFEIDNYNFELCFDTLTKGRIEFVPKKEAAFNNYI